MVTVDPVEPPDTAAVATTPHYDAADDDDDDRVVVLVSADGVPVALRAAAAVHSGAVRSVMAERLGEGEERRGEEGGRTARDRGQKCTCSAPLPAALAPAFATAPIANLHCTPVDACRGGVQRLKRAPPRPTLHHQPFLPPPQPHQPPPPSPSPPSAPPPSPP